MSAPVLDLVLDSPIKVGRKTYDRLHLEEPTARMLIEAEQELDGDISMSALRRYQITFVALVADVPRAVIEAMLARQVIEAANFLTAFIAPPDEPAKPAKTKKQKRKGKRKRAP